MTRTWKASRQEGRIERGRPVHYPLPRDAQSIITLPLVLVLRSHPLEFIGDDRQPVTQFVGLQRLLGQDAVTLLDRNRDTVLVCIAAGKDVIGWPPNPEAFAGGLAHQSLPATEQELWKPSTHGRKSLQPARDLLV